jgi:hypothetical protein
MPLLPDLLAAWQYSFWPLADLQAQSNQIRVLDSDKSRKIYFSGILSSNIDYETSPAIDPWLTSLIYRHEKFTLSIQSQPLN